MHVVARGLTGLALLIAPAQASVTELKANRQGHFVTAAEINGSTVPVMIDTGATAVALSFEDAHAAGLRPGSLEFTVPIATALLPRRSSIAPR